MPTRVSRLPRSAPPPKVQPIRVVSEPRHFPEILRVASCGVVVAVLCFILVADNETLEFVFRDVLQQRVETIAQQATDTLRRFPRLLGSF